MPATVTPDISPSSSRALQQLADELAAYHWTGELLTLEEEPMLRLEPLDGHGDPNRAVDVVVRDRGDGPYFAYPRTPHRSIAPVDQIDQAVWAIRHVNSANPILVSPSPKP
ncbi:hypothetical protein [Actinomadura macra]|uniref:hypothetical protein n=1 Tax=Actinomadura macra TaxID=46164 RepID=UPI00082C6356|nr:hypothetical protein [Actinomadura macra]